MIVTAKDHSGCLRVLLNGADISGDCFEADDVAGTALCYRRDSNGQYLVIGDEVARETRYGKVEIVPCFPAAN
jgi:hypothetical protein